MAITIPCPGRVSPLRLCSCCVQTVRPGARNCPALPWERADFRYAQAWWQSAICLPDDPDKILVGKEGQILLDFGHGVVRNFAIVVQPELDPSGPSWVKQQTISPRTPIVQTFKIAGGVELLEEALVTVPGQGELRSDRATASQATGLAVLHLAQRRHFSRQATAGDPRVHHGTSPGR